MDNRNPYIYTEDNLRGFWFFYGKKNYKNYFEKITQEDIKKIITNKDEYFNNLVWILHLFDLQHDTYVIHDVIFKLNMFLVCEYNTWLFLNIDKNKQWYFNNPCDPFEIYLKCVIKNATKIYATHYPDEKYIEFDIQNK
jgi:hypothetical protein